MLKIGEKTKEIRRYLGLSQQDLAAIIGSSDYKLVGRWETEEIKGPPLTHYGKQVDDIWEKVKFAKAKPAERVSCKLCDKKGSVLELELDRKHSRFLCKSCYYAIYE